ncbi:hypothetical protein H0H92_003879 [Tricholoma furcatifolium]|nr:hypothetical protein H0H92_003879 [Tricholoma furcatifolium]
MAVSKDSPKRRKSIAVTNQNRPAVPPRAKRRPHSIVPGDRLSPFAKARRSLVPRKSILKTFTNTLNNDNDSTQNSQTESSSSQPAHLQSSLDDTTTDFTRDFQTKLQDHPSRKSFGGRRVSFAENVNVRFIENLKKDKNAADSDANNQPRASTSHSDKQTSRPPNDENDYPGASSSSRRRSSARHSLGEDMDITTIGPRAVFSTDDSALVDEEFDFPDDDDDGMDLTDVVRGANVRRRSSSIGRAPLSQSTGDETPSDDLGPSQSFDEHASSDDSNRSEPMDFTMPLSRSKRAPVEQDELWHALRQATHSGDTPIEPEVSSDDMDLDSAPIEDDEMELDDAVQRLMRARLSLPSVLALHTPENAELHANDSFSTENSFEEQRDQTLNLSTVYGRASLGGDISRQSIGSAMDESEVYGALNVPPQSAPMPFTVHRDEVDIPPPPVDEPSSTVFRPPPSAPSTSSEEASHQPPAAPVFIPPTSPSKSKASAITPTSPTKAKQSSARVGFTAAFAPPVARPSPNKRPRAADDHVLHHDLDKPSPAKRASLGGRAQPRAVSSPTPQSLPASVSKKGPFQAPASSTTSQRPSSSLRRPSGYFAKRKSLGNELASQPQEGNIPPTETSPKKRADGLKHGRSSVGSVSSNAWERSGKDTQENAHYGREASRQAVAPSVITRSSPSPAPPRSASPLPTSPRLVPMPVSIEITDASPKLPVVDVSAMYSPDEGEPDDIDMDSTEQWRNAVESNQSIPDYPSVSITEFFAMTGIKFMDELTAPRRSTHPSQQILPQPREPEEIPLADYAVAMGIDLPQLALYSRISRDLETWIEKSKADFEQAEDEAAKITPELFTEYSRADEEGQAELLHQLQLIRTNTRALAKSDWYDWKLQWLEGLRVTAAQTFQSLESDVKTLETMRASVGDLVPSLQQEYEEIMKELERESAEVAEIEDCDQDYLNELKASIAEQNIEVEALKAEVAESKAKLHSLQERLGSINAERHETKAAIDDAQTALHLQKNSTRAEVFKLKDELESLEDLHMLRITKVNSEMFEYIYASQFRVSIPCKNYVPMHTRVDVTRMDKARTKVKDHFPRLSDFLLHMAKEEIVRGDARTTRQIMNRLSDYWSSCAQLRTQLKLLLIKFPVEIEIVKTSGAEPDAFKARVMVIFPSVKAKAFISFVFFGKAFSCWPLAITSLQCEVEVAYGKVDPDVIAKTVVDRLSQSTAEDNYACLLDACIEAQEIYY